jgi:PAS domain S-box-containing protein
VRLARRVVGFASYRVEMGPPETAWWSDELLGILGFEDHGPAGLSNAEYIDRFVHPDDRGWVADAFATAVARVEPFEAEYRIVRRDGAERWVRSFALPERAPGAGVVRMAGLLRGVTEVRQAEAELALHREHLEQLVQERTAALRELNADLEAFSYSVSHDLRSPLRVIANLAEITLEDCGSGMAVECREHLERIVTAAGRANELVRRLVVLGQVEGAALDVRTLDVSAIAREVVDDLRQQSPGRDVDVHIADGVTARGDAMLLHVVLANLIGNAWKFTRERADARIELGVEPGGAVFFVRDNGAGFEPEKAGRIFEPFERLHPQERFGGSGIGLVNAYKAVRRLGGRIWAEGAPGRGANFRFTLGDPAA